MAAPQLTGALCPTQSPVTKSRDQITGGVRCFWQLRFLRNLKHFKMPMKLAAHDSILKFHLKHEAERSLRVPTKALGMSPGVAGARAPRTLQKTASLATNPSPQSSSPPWDGASAGRWSRLEMPVLQSCASKRSGQHSANYWHRDRGRQTRFVSESSKA